MFRTRSITFRIISLHVVAVGLTALFMPLALYWRLSSVATDLRHRALREHAQEIARYLSWNEQGWTFGLPEGLRELYATSYGRYTYAVLDANGKILFAPEGDKHSLLAPVTSPSFATVRRGKAVLDIAAIPMMIDGHRVTVQVAEDLEHRDVLIDDIVADFFRRIGWITLPILFSLLLADIVIFRRALLPVLRASEMAQRIGPRRVDLRLPTSGMPSDVLPLVQAVNQAFDRLERGFRIQREFTADAAHELRTPLTVLQTRLATMRGDEALQPLRDDVAAMARVVNQLLQIAELEALEFDPAETCDLHAVCADAVAYLAPLALSQKRDLVLTGMQEPVWVYGNPDTLFQALRNLIENAIKHTAPRTVVEIEVDKDGTARVLDFGPGIKEAARELIFRRFWRGDRRGMVGAGLGLAIVSRIMEAHGGTIAAENRPGGGAVFTIALRPAAKVPADTAVVRRV